MMYWNDESCQKQEMHSSLFWGGCPISIACVGPVQECASLNGTQNTMGKMQGFYIGGMWIPETLKFDNGIKQFGLRSEWL